MPVQDLQINQEQPENQQKTREPQFFPVEYKIHISSYRFFDVDHDVIDGLDKNDNAQPLDNSEILSVLNQNRSGPGLLAGFHFASPETEGLMLITVTAHIYSYV